MTPAPAPFTAPRAIAQVVPRAPETVLRLERMGSFHQTRLSFMRVLLRRLGREGWRVERPLWDIDAKGEGVAVYEARGEGRLYALVCFGHDLDPRKRTDRVIAEAWDATFALHDGPVGAADIERLCQNVPRQEAGRCSAAELVMARANRSVRLFDHVVACLAQGRQPEAAELDAVGYLMRTTAVYGSGKFGLADRERIAGRPEFAGPFAAEMLTVWLIRLFTTDLAEHMAALRSPRTAVPLDPALRRRLGVGNATGLGMAPFVVNHPALFGRWIDARETALARVRAVERATDGEIAVLRDRLRRSRRQMAGWRTDDEVQARRIENLRRDLDRLSAHLEEADLATRFPWERLHAFAEAELGLEAQEFLVTLLLEPYGALVDDLADTMAGDEAPDFPIDGAATLASLRAQIESVYRFALGTDFSDPAARARFWYVSAEKLEPRLGERALEEGAEREQPLGVARDVAHLHETLRAASPDTTVAAFLAARPEFRHTVRRVQLAARRPYAEIRDNLLAAGMRPVDILRCKLSFFGATDFDPRSDRWVRIALYRHAPFPDELHGHAADDWAIPPLVAPAEPARSQNGSGAGGIGTPSPDRPSGFSLGEIEAELRKAARGAGLPWGLAEEVGHAARALAKASPNAFAALAHALEALQAGRHGTRMACAGTALRPIDGRPLSPLAVGPAIADRAAMLEQASLTIEAAVASLCLLAPALAGVAERSERAVLLRAGGRELVVGADIAQAATALDGLDAGDGLTISLLPASRPPGGSPPRPAEPVAIPEGLWRRFGRLAALTYVPASDRSRLAGAGAGLVDND
ncbi:MAG TPA: DUF3726 domain-containing protein [Mesorhizobium sp.]|jgi:hypothetical protein|nr:DUF3726 domain-containing protein [Mesorhizobium sp.]